MPDVSSLGSMGQVVKQLQRDIEDGKRKPQLRPVRYTSTTVNNIGLPGTGAPGVTVSGIQIPVTDPGVPYTVLAGGSLQVLLGPSIQVKLQIRSGTKDGPLLHGEGVDFWSVVNTGGSAASGFFVNGPTALSPATYTGDTTFHLCMAKQSGPTGNGFNAETGPNSQFWVLAVPL